MVRTPWAWQGPPTRGKDPLGVTMTPRKWQKATGSSRDHLKGSRRDPLEAAGTPRKQQGPLGSGRDSLEATGSP